MSFLEQVSMKRLTHFRHLEHRFPFSVRLRTSTFGSIQIYDKIMGLNRNQPIRNHGAHSQSVCLGSRKYIVRRAPNADQAPPLATNIAKIKGIMQLSAYIDVGSALASL